jgi:uncharacterized protein (DUF362 family)
MYIYFRHYLFGSLYVKTMNDKLYLIHGENPKEMTFALLDYIKPFSQLKKDAVIGIKPNLVNATLASHGATTHPQIVEAIILRLQENGFSHIKILESSWVGASTKEAFDVCGYTELSKKYGVPLIDLKEDNYIKKQYQGMDFHICSQIETTDYLINIPLIKGHCQIKITCALKNLKGVIPDSEKRRYHRLGLHKPIAFLNKLVKQHFIIADALCPDPYFEEGGRPEKLNFIAAGFDPVLMDCYAAHILNHQASDIEYINIAAQERVGSPLKSPNQLVTLNPPFKSFQTCSAPQTQAHVQIKNEKDACSACHSNVTLALNQLKDKSVTNIAQNKIPDKTQDKLPDKIAIGQGYLGHKGSIGQIGIGDCTAGFTNYLDGCPPSVDDIASFLEEASEKLY